ncbi:MAG TPA: 8-amino-7-oxononanoate synthase [Gammaproteobacteria bacterium]|nr:8-amino-7-oxononanoate synthase [Gammaproteobacteria bacterium]
MATRPATDALRGELARLEQADLYRRRRVCSWDAALAPAELRVDGRRMLAFCSNDYLGLARDRRLGEAMARAASRWGAGSGAAHLVTGHTTEHHSLEEELAAFTGFERALLFSTGYMANLGLLGALAGRGDLVAEDRLNHASLIDAARLSGARARRYAHADPAAAARRLGEAAARKFIVTDGVFSMDGDAAPLAELARVAAESGAGLLVDDAHGLGVAGADGRGSLAAAGLPVTAVTAMVGTLGKAFGTFGAFVAGSEEVVETLVQRARSYIYTTAPPPAVAAATRAALRLAREEPWRRTHVLSLARRFRAGARGLGLRLTPSASPIQPLLAGEAQAALAAADALFEAGIWVTPIRPPTVPAGSARLRITFSAAHREADVDRLLDALAGVTALRGPTGS